MLKFRLANNFRHFIFSSKPIYSFSQKEVFDLRKPDKSVKKKYNTPYPSARVMIIHPIFYPKFKKNLPFLFYKPYNFKKNSMGPINELYFAEEAIGLAKSLKWTVILDFLLSIYSFYNFIGNSRSFLERRGGGKREN